MTLILQSTLAYILRCKHRHEKFIFILHSVLPGNGYEILYAKKFHVWSKPTLDLPQSPRACCSCKVSSLTGCGIQMGTNENVRQSLRWGWKAMVPGQHCNGGIPSTRCLPIGHHLIQSTLWLCQWAEAENWRRLTRKVTTTTSTQPGTYTHVKPQRLTLGKKTDISALYNLLPSCSRSTEYIVHTENYNSLAWG